MGSNLGVDYMVFVVKYINVNGYGNIYLFFGRWDLIILSGILVMVFLFFMLMYFIGVGNLEFIL